MDPRSVDPLHDGRTKSDTRQGFIKAYGSILSSAADPEHPFAPYRTILEHLASSTPPPPLLVHCTAGKDSKYLSSRRSPAFLGATPAHQAHPQPGTSAATHTPTCSLTPNLNLSRAHHHLLQSLPVPPPIRPSFTPPSPRPFKPAATHNHHHHPNKPNPDSPTPNEPTPQHTTTPTPHPNPPLLTILPKKKEQA